jgi:hypothetical protein
MSKHSKISLILYLGLITSPISVNAEEGLMVPKKGTVYEALLHGLKLLAVGDIDQWISGSCDGIRLCSNAANVNHIRNYRAALQEKIATTCLKKGGEALDIHHVVGNPEIDIAVKIYLNCEENGPPRFYSLRRTMDFWFFISL